MVAHKLPLTPVSGDPTPSHRHTCRQNINAYEIKIKSTLKNYGSLEISIEWGLHRIVLSSFVHV